ncbi:50S ribosomal protein L29 [Candidatus Nomurabacteria bacterium]|nr:50S ribosomal protein L29 [Candidatus Nomurabacteria bacterium]
MKTMADIRKLSDKELQELVTERREEMRSARFNHASRDVRAVRAARHEIARALTELTARGKEAPKAETN